MDGMNANTGTRLTGINHLRQSIRDILTTPLGSRVMRRDYGSRLYQLVDAPMNRGTLLQIYAATAEALRQWEPRFRLERVRAETAEPGRVVLELTGEYLPDGQEVTLDGIEVT
jgi:phage baseplate assembly protein W